MIIHEDNYTYSDFDKLLSSSEKELLFKIFEHMTEDNLLYLYQTISKRDNRRYIDKIAEEMDIGVRRVQNMISKIMSKQHVDRYFLYKTKSGIRGEYFINPFLVVKRSKLEGQIFKSIVPKLEAEAKISNII